MVSIFEENIFVGNLEVQQLIWLPYYCYIHLRTCIVIKNFFQMVFIQTKLPTRCPKYDQYNMFQHHPTPYSNTISIHLKTIFRAFERHFCFCNFFNDLWYKQQKKNIIDSFNGEVRSSERPCKTNFNQWLKHPTNSSQSCFFWIYLISLYSPLLLIKASQLANTLSAHVNLKHLFAQVEIQLRLSCSQPFDQSYPFWVSINLSLCKCGSTDIMRKCGFTDMCLPYFGNHDSLVISFNWVFMLSFF